MKLDDCDLGFCDTSWTASGDDDILVQDDAVVQKMRILYCAPNLLHYANVT